jgi:hypothetical protein
VDVIVVFRRNRVCIIEDIHQAAEGFLRLTEKPGKGMADSLLIHFIFIRVLLDDLDYNSASYMVHTRQVT